MYFSRLVVAIALLSGSLALPQEGTLDPAPPSEITPDTVIQRFTAREWTQQYEWTHHYGFAVKEGLAKSVIEAIADGRRPDKMSEDETAAYDFAIELHRRRSVSDPTYARALKLYGEQGIIDLVGLCGYYSFNAMMMNVSRTPADMDDVPLLRQFPD